MKFVDIKRIRDTRVKAVALDLEFSIEAKATSTKHGEVN